MVSGKKVFIFGILGLALGYFCHRLVLLYDSLPNQPPLEPSCLSLRRGTESGLKSLVEWQLYRYISFGILLWICNDGPSLSLCLNRSKGLPRRG